MADLDRALVAIVDIVVRVQIVVPFALSDSLWAGRRGRNPPRRYFLRRIELRNIGIGVVGVSGDSDANGVGGDVVEGAVLDQRLWAVIALALLDTHHGLEFLHCRR